MKKYILLLHLVLTALLTCGFDWGFGSSDKCGDAKKLVTELGLQKTDAERATTEERILKLCPEGAAGRYLNAVNLEKSGNIEGAVIQYREVLKEDPAFPQASGNLGLIHLQQGRKDEAAVELSEALKNLADPRYHRGLASIFSDYKLYSLSIYHYGEAVRLSPSDPSLHLALAGVCSAMGRLDSAEDEYLKTLALTPGNEAARLGLAAVLIKKNQVDKGVAEFKKALEANPANKEIHILLGGAYEKKADWKAAENEYRLAGLSAGGKPSLYAGRVRKGDEYFQAKEYEKAVAEYQGAVKEKPESPDALQKLGNALMAAGQDDNAVAAYREALRLKGDNGVIHFSLGMIYEKKGLLDEAVVEYRQSLKHLPEHADARRRLAESYTLRGSFPQAVEQDLELLKIVKNDPQVHMKLARVYVNT